VEMLNGCSLNKTFTMVSMQKENNIEIFPLSINLIIKQLKTQFSSFYSTSVNKKVQLEPHNSMNEHSSIGRAGIQTWISHLSLVIRLVDKKKIQLGYLSL
jgi:hypothetical protein